MINFTATGVVVSQTLSDTIERLYGRIYESLNSYEYKLCTMRDIDNIPVPVFVIRPDYPPEIAAKNIAGEVSVAFFIDETGAIRMPAVTQSDSQILSDLAINALRQWKFEPPTRKGLPVLVKAVQLFKFVPGSKVEIKAGP
jgi:TonB family protein